MKTNFKVVFYLSTKMDAFDHGKYYPMDDELASSHRREVVRDMYVVIMAMIIYFTAFYFILSKI